MINVVYQAYGDKKISRELIYSLYTFLANFKDDLEKIRVVIYADDPEFFFPYLQQFPTYIKIDNHQIQTWASVLGFVHRIKIEMILDCFSKFDGSVLYLDTDTIINKDISKLISEISTSRSIMHVYEGQINKPKNPMMRKINKFLKKHYYELKISNKIPMWNAGVLGIAEGHESMVRRVLDVTDKTYSKSPKHVMEQLAFSYILNENTTIVAAEDHIIHYWKLKADYQMAIDQFISRLQLSSNILNNVINGEIDLRLALAPPKGKWELKILKWKNSFKKVWLKIVD